MSNDIDECRRFSKLLRAEAKKRGISVRELMQDEYWVSQICLKCSLKNCVLDKKEG